MLNSSLRIQWISDEKGYGVFASKDIRKGTVTFALDPLDIVIEKSQVKKQSDIVKYYIDRFSYEGPDGSRIISWDFGKYMNHCCSANTLTTGYGFEIAIRDIQAGEEVTDDYRIFTTDHQLNMSCDKPNCTQSLDFNYEEHLITRWDNQIREALMMFNYVDQELKPFIPIKALSQVNGFITGQADYLSVVEQIPKRPVKEIMLEL